MKTLAIEPADPGCNCCGVDSGRRMALKAAAGIGLAASVGIARADDGPRAGDWLVSIDDDAKKPLSGGDLKVDQKPVIVYPYDPAAKALRDGSRLNRIVLVKLDPSTLDGPTAARAADGVVAYSAFCTHQGCDVNSWVAAEKVLLCFCHFSKFAPQQEASVVGGPAPRPLPALPLESKDGKLVLAGGFNQPPGKSA